MSNFEIGSAVSIQLLWIVLVGFVIALIALRKQRRQALQFASRERLATLLHPHQRQRRLGSLALICLICTLLVFCVVDIRWGKVRREIPQQGIEVVFLLDVSRSMLAEDIKPNRLQQAKQMIKDVVDEMTGDRVGLAIFAGQARQQIPLTQHYDDFKQTLNEVTTDDLIRGGSNLGQAIDVAADAFHEKTLGHRAIVILTDGEDHESEPIEAAREAYQEKGIRIFTIGLGDDQRGARIPLASEGRSGFLQHEGQPVRSRLRGDVLAEVASVSNAAYIPAGTRQVAMSEVYYGYLADVEKTEFGTAEINAYEARYQWFCGLALLLLVSEIALATKIS